MLFWVACEDLKRESNPDVVEEKARLIYEDYISILSPREVSSTERQLGRDKGTDFRTEGSEVSNISTFSILET